MPLIDHTYFIGELNLPGTNKTDMQKRLNLFIVKYEQKFLTELLGYDLYTKLIAGLKVGPVEQKWLDIVFGTEYYYAGRTHRWKGLIELPDGVTAAIDTDNFYTVIAGRGQMYDPVANASSVIIPPQFVGSITKVSRRGVGYLRADEFTITGNILQLTGYTFVSGDTFFYEKSSNISLTPLGNSLPLSIIANYVYYWWMRNEVTQTAMVGEVMTTTENAVRVSPSGKMARAWNEMVEGSWELIRFLDAFPDTYTQYRSPYRYWNSFTRARMSDVFYPINEFNL